MSAIDDLKAAFRKYVTEGVPASGVHQPVKEEISAAFDQLATQLSSIGAGLLRYETKALLVADTAQADGQLGYVWGDLTAANNTVYQSDGGVWTEAAWYFDAVAAVVQPLVDEAEAWATGTEPGGAGTLSAREEADRASAFSTNMEALVTSIITGEFNPDLLYFTGSDKGAYLDPATTALYQDTAGTTPATTSGQIVKRADLVYPGVGTGGNLTEATNGPALTITSDGAYLLDFDGVNDSLEVATFDLAGVTGATFVFGIVQKTAGTAASVVFEHGSSSVTAGLGALFNNGSPIGNVSGAAAVDTSNRITNNGRRSAAPREAVVTIRFNPAAATPDDAVTLRVDGQEIDENQLLNSGTLTTAIFALRALYIGARTGGSLFANMSLAGWLGIGRLLTDAECAAIERYWQARLNPALPYAASIFDFADSAAMVQESLHLRPSTFAQATFLTTSTSIDVSAYENLALAYDALARVGVYVNGAYHSSITVNSATTARVTLPAGEKYVAIVAGPQVTPTAPTGVFPYRVRGNAALTQVDTEKASDILCYGDSITVGDGATVPMQDAWPLQVRVAAEAQGQRLAVEAQGGRALWDDAVDATARAAFVAKLATYGPTDIVFLIGTNDYALNRWSAASFQTAYSAVLTDLATALPAATVHCVSPVDRTSEGANTFGNTTQDYRNAISAAVAANPTNSVYIDGAAILTTAELADGVHPTTAGHNLIAAAVKTALGL